MLKDIWRLGTNQNISLVDKIVLYSTFDYVLIKREDIPELLNAFRSFEGITSLPEQAAAIENMFKNDDLIAIGFNQTSISSDSWRNYHYDNSDPDFCASYNMLTESEHWWLFEEIKAGSSEQVTEQTVL